MERKITLPGGTGSGGTVEINLIDNLVLVGANGSGKSRMGSWIEASTNVRPVKRISAQRILSMPDFAPLKSLEQSINELLGSWRNRSVIEVQSDYEQVLSTLFAETTKRDREYVALCRSESSNTKPPIPESAIEKLIRIWNDVLPQRKITIVDSRVHVTPGDGSAAYGGREMSDGERVALYLIAQVLCVPEYCLVIIDEPELHLHKALMARLWNKIEQERTDCIFVYITHDLDFAASRVKAEKIWLKSYNQGQWIWERVPDSEEIPENLLLEIIGSRKPILFVEGDRGSYDHAIYQEAFPVFTIVPRGGATQVIASTKGMRANSSLHSINAFGLIDRDFKNDDELKALLENGIYTLDFAEVENLLLIPQLIKLVAVNQALPEDETFAKVKEFVLKKLRDDFDRVVSSRTSMEVAFKLNALDLKQVGITNIQAAVSSLVTSIDVGDLYSKNENLYQQILDNTDYDSALKFYNNKGLLPNVSSLLGLKGREFPQLVLRLLGTEKKKEIIEALRKYLPEIKLENESGKPITNPSVEETPTAVSS